MSAHNESNIAADLVRELVQRQSQDTYHEQLRKFAAQYFTYVASRESELIYSAGGVSIYRAIHLGIQEVAFGSAATKLRIFAQLSKSERQASGPIAELGCRLVIGAFQTSDVVDQSELLQLQGCSVREVVTVHTDISGLPNEPHDLLHMVEVLHSIEDNASPQCLPMPKTQAV